MDNSCESISRLEVKILALAEAYQGLLGENQALKELLEEKELAFAELEKQHEKQTRVFSEVDQRMVSLLSRIDDCLPAESQEDLAAGENPPEVSRPTREVQVLPGMHDS